MHKLKMPTARDLHPLGHAKIPCRVNPSLGAVGNLTEGMETKRIKTRTRHPITSSASWKAIQSDLAVEYAEDLPEVEAQTLAREIVLYNMCLVGATLSLKGSGLKLDVKSVVALALALRAGVDRGA
jgi:hypothetical protein